MGYVITGILALALGVLSSLTCIHYKIYKKMENEDK